MSFHAVYFEQELSKLPSIIRGSNAQIAEKSAIGPLMILVYGQGMHITLFDTLT